MTQQPMTAKEYQKLLCPKCGNRKPQAEVPCPRCNQAAPVSAPPTYYRPSRPPTPPTASRPQRPVTPRQDPCPQCSQPKLAHYDLCDDCKVNQLMTCRCGRRKAHPEHQVCRECHEERKLGKLPLCECSCQCGNKKTRPEASVCGPCHVAGHHAW